MAISSLVLVTGVAMGEAVAMTSSHFLACKVSDGNIGKATASMELGTPFFISAQGFSSSFPMKTILDSECSKMYLVVSAVRVG